MEINKIDNHIDFCNHCDYEDCDMGTAEYSCQNCNSNIINYDLWYVWLTSPIGSEINVEDCEKCGQKMIAINKKCGWIIKKII